MTARETPLAHSDVTHQVIGAFYDAFNTLGFGFLESVYVAALCVELERRGPRFERQVPVPINYKGTVLAVHRLDLLVQGCVVVEVKTGEALHQIAHAQLANYLRATGIEVGLLLHFGAKPEFYRAFRSRRRYPPQSEFSAQSAAKP